MEPGETKVVPVAEDPVVEEESAEFRERSKREFLDQSKWVSVCYVWAHKGREFRAYVRSRGVDTVTFGGEESTQIFRVYEGNLERFLEIVDTEEVRERFKLRIIDHPKEGAKGGDGDREHPSGVRGAGL